MNRLTLVGVVVLAVIAFALTACDDSGHAVTIPSTSTPISGPIVATVPAPGPGSNNATPIQIGDTVMGTLHGTDSFCLGYYDPMDTSGLNGGFPCQPYKVTAPASGTVTIRITWDNASNALCGAFNVPAYGTTRRCLKSPLTVAWQANAQQVYGFGVEFMGARHGITTTLAPDASQSYTLTASFSPSLVVASASGAGVGK